MQEGRIEKLEENMQQQAAGQDYIINIVEDDVAVGPDNERIPIHRDPVDWDEGPWTDAGDGDRIKIRRAVYPPDADHGILRDEKVTG